MPVNAVTDRTDSTCVDDESLGMSVCAPAGGEPPPAASSANSTSSSDSSSTAIQSLVAKFPHSSRAALPDAAGCGTVQDCAGSDGRSVVEGQDSSGPDAQFSVTARRFAPFENFGLGFEGDALSRGSVAGKGGFSASPSVTSRTSMTLSVDGNSITPEAHADMSHHAFFGTGRAHVFVEDSSASASSQDGSINASSAGANPLLVLSPDIDTDVQVAYRSDGQTLTLDGTVWGDQFPNAEVLVSDRAQNGVLLDTFQTGGDQNFGPLFHLPGDASRADGSKFELMHFQAQIALDPEGNFAATPNVTNR